MPNNIDNTMVDSTKAELISKKKIWTYVGVLFFVSWILQWLAIKITGGITSDKMVIWLAGVMLTPFLVSLVFISRYKTFKEKLLWKPNINLFVSTFFAVLLPILIAFAVLVFLHYFDFGRSDWFSFSATSVSIHGGPFFLGKGEQSWGMFMLNIFLTGAAFALLNSFIAAGEEFAWRGMLQPLLTDQYGLMKGITMLGFLWAMWHLPILLAGYNYPETPILGALILFPLRLIAVSFFYAWLTIKSNSFIPAAIAHGALNGIQTGVISNIKMNSSQLVQDMTTMIVEILVGLIFLLLLVRLSKPKSVTY